MGICLLTTSLANLFALFRYMLAYNVLEEAARTAAKL